MNYAFICKIKKYIRNNDILIKILKKNYFCEEEIVQPLSHATLFRILEVRAVSQQKLLSGLDNTAADGSAGFEKLKTIVDHFQKNGKEKGWSEDIKKALQSGERYLKTEYRGHCQQGDSTCPNHCTKFALSDP